MLILKEQYLDLGSLDRHGIMVFICIVFMEIFLKDLISIKYVLPFSFVFGVLADFQRSLFIWLLEEPLLFFPFSYWAIIVARSILKNQTYSKDYKFAYFYSCRNLLSMYN